MHLGIDLGGTKTEIVVLDQDWHLLDRHRVPSPKGNYQKTLDTLCELIHQAEEKFGSSTTIGMGIPGNLSPENGRVKNANSTWLIGKDLKRDLEIQVNRSIAITNDADCFTLSEAMQGAGKGCASVFGVILGTGVGGGIFMNNALVSGPNAIAGEWGHNPLPWPREDDPQLSCYCGKTGCIETLLSGPGLQKQYNQFFKPAAESAAETAETVVDRMDHPQSPAGDCFKRYLDQLSRALASVINILDPEIIVFGGGISNIDRLYKDLPARVEPYIFSDSLRTRFAKASHGDSSGVLGAAWLGRKAYENSGGQNS